MVIKFPIFDEYIPDDFTEEIFNIFRSLPEENRESYVVDFKNYFFEKTANDATHPQTITVGEDLKDPLGEPLSQGVSYIVNAAERPSPANKCVVSLCTNREGGPNLSLNLTKLGSTYDVVRSYSLVLSKPTSREMRMSEIVDALGTEYRYFVKKHTKGKDEVIYSDLQDVRVPSFKNGTSITCKLKNKFISKDLGDLYLTITNISPTFYEDHRVLLNMNMVYAFNIPEIPGVSKDAIIQDLDEQYENLVDVLENHLTLIDPYADTENTI